MSALTPNHWEYQHRAKLVYGLGAPSCGKKAPFSKAECVLEPNHDGNWHEGNSYDEWGPKYRVWLDSDGEPFEMGRK